MGQFSRADAVARTPSADGRGARSTASTDVSRGPGAHARGWSSTSALAHPGARRSGAGRGGRSRRAGGGRSALERWGRREVREQRAPRGHGVRRRERARPGIEGERRLPRQPQGRRGHGGRRHVPGRRLATRRDGAGERAGDVERLVQWPARAAVEARGRGWTANGHRRGRCGRLRARGGPARCRVLEADGQRAGERLENGEQEREQQRHVRNIARPGGRRRQRSLTTVNRMTGWISQIEPVNPWPPTTGRLFRRVSPRGAWVAS